MGFHIAFPIHFLEKRLDICLETVYDGCFFQVFILAVFIFLPEVFETSSFDIIPVIIDQCIEIDLAVLIKQRFEIDISEKTAALAVEGGSKNIVYCFFVNRNPKGHIPIPVFLDQPMGMKEFYHIVVDLEFLFFFGKKQLLYEYAVLFCLSEVKNGTGA